MGHREADRRRFFRSQRLPGQQGDSDQYQRCGKCTQVFEHQELEDGLCGWCAQAAREDLAAGAELEPSVRYAGRS